MIICRTKIYNKSRSLSLIEIIKKEEQILLLSLFLLDQVLQVYNFLLLVVSLLREFPHWLRLHLWLIVLEFKVEVEGLRDTLSFCLFG